jgi:RluA family pseudouridine synthase
VTVPQEVAGQRVDVAVARLAPDISRRQARRLVDSGSVFVDGKRLQVCSRPVRAGSVLEVHLAPPRESPDVRVILADESIVVVDKPAGTPTEATREGAAGTLAHALSDKLREAGQDTTFLHAANRLDTDTTGVVLFARSNESARSLAAQLHGQTAVRRYLAVVAGDPKWLRARLDQPLGKAKDGSGKVVADAEGAPCLTLATVVARGPDGALVHCAPLTGRTHQLRVHLANTGHPLVGDKKYGRPLRGVPHLGLHALSIAFAHPARPDDGLLRVSAPLPPEFLEACATVGVAAAAARAVARTLCPELS